MSMKNPWLCELQMRHRFVIFRLCCAKNSIRSMSSVSCCEHCTLVLVVSTQTPIVMTRQRSHALARGQMDAGADIAVACG